MSLVHHHNKYTTKESRLNKEEVVDPFLILCKKKIKEVSSAGLNNKML
jgi:hypothetical protein